MKNTTLNANLIGHLKGEIQRYRLTRKSVKHYEKFEINFKQEVIDTMINLGIKDCDGVELREVDREVSVSIEHIKKLFNDQNMVDNFFVLVDLKKTYEHLTKTLGLTSEVASKIVYRIKMSHTEKVLELVDTKE